MNKYRTTEHKVEWTTQGLNVMLPVYHDAHNLTESHSTSEASYVRGTQADVDKLVEVICARLGTNNIEWPVAWQPDIWYSAPQPDLAEDSPPSDFLENAWAQMGDVYIRHQYTWGDELDVMDIDDLSSSESESSDSSDEDSDQSVDLDIF